ncbi:hypothetical protein [Actinomadura sp. K4S16]|uniref:hypothetical protein n=1 Tax=Actinomadura sp. K4S16 TaxID=1316147 RepID=UPI0011F044EC|nr:hypothetical protein [Actinomadura sp. K4S16]
MTGQLYGLWGERSGCLLTWRGRVITHTSRAELEYLYPDTRIVPVPRGIRPDEHVPLQYVPTRPSGRPA